jgi:hypothetical protein
VYSPESLLQIHHLRHEELVAAARRRAPVAPVRRARPVALGRAARTGAASAQRAVVALVARAGAALGTGTDDRRRVSHDPVCCAA